MESLARPGDSEAGPAPDTCVLRAGWASHLARGGERGQVGGGSGVPEEGKMGNKPGKTPVSSSSSSRPRPPRPIGEPLNCPAQAALGEHRQAPIPRAGRAGSKQKPGAAGGSADTTCSLPALGLGIWGPKVWAPEF